MTQQIDEKEIFDVATSIGDGHDRNAYLDSVCGRDSEMRRRIEQLLVAHATQTQFLAGGSPIHQLQGLSEAARIHRGTVVGRYKILEQIGEGGFGVVYMAEQKEPIRRKVALKIIKPGMDTNEVSGRFEAERQALAMMDHPHIARVLDAGTTETGRPYFVMELVRGTSLVEFCDDNKLSLRERLDLFTPVCQAIQHAHQKGVIHRDIKPSNILVTMHDDKAVPKVIDFGIAKALHTELTVRTVFTQFRQLIGTPSYMSPEQAQMSGLDVDTRCDVYALGVVLYELLTGTTPFDPQELLQGGYDDICRRIREQEPPRPSNRLSTMDGVSRSSVARSRQADPDKLGIFMRGDLDWVVMKAMEKDRTRRYQTVNELCDDIRRYLKGDAVLACPPTLRYRVSKFVRKNRTRVAVGSVFLMLLCLSTIISSALYFDARLARDATEVQKNVAEQKTVEAERHLAASNVRLLSAQSQALKLESPVTSTLLALAAVEQSQDEGGTLQPLAYEALVAALGSLGGEPLPSGTGLMHLVSAPSGDWIAAARAGGSISIDIVGQGLTPRHTTIRRAHNSGIRAMAPAPDGTLYSAAEDGIRAWSVGENGQAELVMEFPCQAVSLAISPDGQWMAAGTWNSTQKKTIRHISIWNLAAKAKEPARRIGGLRSGVHELHFTPDSSRLITKEGHEGLDHEGADRKDMILHVWDVETGEKRAVLRGPEDWVTEFAISPNGRWVASGGYDGAVRLWDLQASSKDTEGMVLTDTQLSFECLVMSPDNRWLAAGLLNAIHVWDLQDPDPISTHDILYGPTDEVTTLAFTSDAQRLISGGADRVARVWEIGPDGKFGPRATLRGHGDKVTHIEVDARGAWVVTGSEDGTLRRWDVTTHNLAGTYPQTPAPTGGDYEPYWVIDLVVSNDGRWLAAADNGHGIRLWRADDLNAPPILLRGHLRAVTSLAFASDGRHLFSGAADGTVRRWDLYSEGKQSVRIAESAGRRIRSVSVTGDSNYLCVRELGGRVSLWCQKDGQFEFVDALNADQVSFADQSGRVFCTGNARGELVQWRATPTSIERVGMIEQLDAGISAIAYNASSSTLAVSASGVIHLYDTAAGQITKQRELSGTIAIHDLVFRSDGKWLYAGHVGRVLEGWDLQQPGSSPSLVIRGQELKSIAVFPDGQRLVTGGRERAPRIWTLVPDDLLTMARRKAGRDLTEAERQRFNVSATKD